jgi:hypothetical protein
MGTLAGDFYIQTGAVTNTGAVLGSGKYADGVGQLGADSQIALWVDVNDNGVFDAGDLCLTSSGTVETYTAAGGVLPYDSWNNFASKTWKPVIASMAPNAIVNCYINYQIPTSVTNEIQGDSVQLSLTFCLNQVGQ